MSERATRKTLADPFHGKPTVVLHLNRETFKRNLMGLPMFLDSPLTVIKTYNLPRIKKHGKGRAKQRHKGLGTKGPITKGPGTKGLGTKGPITKGPGTKGPGTKGPITKGPGTKGPGTKKGVNTGRHGVHLDGVLAGGRRTRSQRTRRQRTRSHNRTRSQRTQVVRK